ncbi:serine/threonine-protein kinase [Archangium sp. Cb G35]|uniref:serine/threonine protein kinase n=1 Tax=Archangium sp. Cb G35 TaxID=1920190 RepID=UPI000AB49E73|nr:serine/threonine-protein kinase [Archangium sp. Cb G35]
MRRAWVYRLPQPDEKVGQYRVVGPLGRGGQGHVFLAEWEGRSYVLKFFRSLPVSHSGELELDILRHLEHPNVVRVLGHGRWPYPEEGYFYLVMEYVPGRTLLGHALEHNPSARTGATLLLEAARALAVVHRQGVLHRDVKPDNLLVRKEDGKPVWVDFGVGHLEGRATLPRMRRLPPGTPEYTSPEAYRFLEEHPEEEARYQPGVADEVWAFGVTMYELLTDALPFGSRMGNPCMVKDIRTRTPVAPHVDNRRVPVALGQVCMNMLEKEPRARLADMDAVAAALEAALAGAEANWDVPMMDPFALEVRTTERTPSKVVALDSWERVLQQMKAAMPRRGRVRKARREPPPRAPTAVAPLEEEALAGSFEALAEAAEVRLYAPAPPVSAKEAVAVPAPTAEARHDAVAPGASTRGMGRGRPTRAGAVAVTLLLVLAGTWALHSRLESGGQRPSVSAAPEVASPPGWWAAPPTPHPGLVREVAGPDEPSEAGGGAVASPGTSPVPTTKPMPRENDTRSKSQQKPAPRPQRQAPGCVPARQELCLVGICTVLLTGCTSTPQVVRPPPRPADCPPGAVKTMEELGIRVSRTAHAEFPHEGSAKRVTVHESTPMKVYFAMNSNYQGPLDVGELTGRLYLGPERVYGRFTQARHPGTGKTYPVCMELIGNETDWGEPPGVDRKDVGGPADAAIVFSTQRIRAVRRFE